MFHSGAEKAVDGNDNPSWFTDSTCTATGDHDMPWFVVDLGTEQEVVGVAIVNRQGDACKNCL